ncbi:hypothetical protein GJAV_G00146370, partial [Gymnothorax javanicus]
MVRVCCFPGRESKAVSRCTYSFHRMPLRDGLRQVWLAALNMDIDTPSVSRKELCVCSIHFSKEDFVRLHSGKSQQCTLRSTAVPMHQVSLFLRKGFKDPVAGDGVESWGCGRHERRSWVELSWHQVTGNTWPVFPGYLTPPAQLSFGFVIPVEVGVVVVAVGPLLKPCCLFFLCLSFILHLQHALHILPYIHAPSYTTDIYFHT